MTLFLLIRHGENDYVKSGRLAGRTPGVHLNERGRQQADALGEALRPVPLAAVYSSPLERALETAGPIAAGRGLEIQTRPALIEADIGDWQGRELKQLGRLPEWKLVQNQPSRFRFPHGESFQELQTRLVSEMECLLGLHQADDIVAVVFHADPIKLVIAYYLGMPLDNFQRIACDTGSAAVLHLSPGGAALLKQNMLPPFNLPSPPKPRPKRTLLERLFHR